MDKKVKIGIVGIGNMGTAHLNCIKNGEIKGLCVTAVCDNSPSRFDFLRENYADTEVYSNYKELISSENVDAVLICTPHPSHCEIAEAALRAGKHILVEKPIDISVTKAERLNALAKDSGRVFGIMFNQRTNDLFQKAREIVTSGELGQLKRSAWIITNWYRTQGYYDSGAWRATWAGEGGGVLLNQAPHNLDLWQWICGMPKSITAFCNIAKFHNIEVEDEATIYTEYENGATGVFITSTGDLPGTNRLEISGSKGKLVIENGVLKHWKLHTDERQLCFGTAFEGNDSDYEYIEYKSQGETAHRGILQNFTDAVLFDEPLLASGIEGINELTISNAAYLSQWQGNEKIEIPFDSSKFDRLLKKRTKVSKFKTETISLPNGKYKPRWQVNW